MRPTPFAFAAAVLLLAACTPSALPAPQVTISPERPGTRAN